MSAMKKQVPMRRCRSTTNRITGCCAGSSGPGHVHLINGLYDAQRSGAPVLAIASTIPTGEFGTEYFQETNTIKLIQRLQLLQRSGNNSSTISPYVTIRSTNRNHPQRSFRNRTPR